jgi:hypothetical protein
MAWTWPAVCKTISQGYGVKNARYAKGYHTGLDIACPNGSPIRAATDGRITYAGWAGAYGNQVKQAVGGAEIWYNHMQKLAVTAGQNVSAGTIVGWEGTTGNSTGPHLHFEVRVNGKDVNPMPYLTGSAVVPASTTGDQVISNPFSAITGLKDFFDMLNDPITWMRVGMVIGGTVLIIMAAVGIAKTKLLGKQAVKAVKSSAIGSARASKPSNGAGSN